MPGHIPKWLYSLLQRFPPINVHCCSNITARKWEIQSSGTRVSTVWPSKGRRGSKRKDMGVYLECLRSWQGRYIAVRSVPWRALLVGVSVLTLGKIPYYIHFCGVRKARHHPGRDLNSNHSAVVFSFSHWCPVKGTSSHHSRTVASDIWENVSVLLRGIRWTERKRGKWHISERRTLFSEDTRWQDFLKT